MWTVGTMVSRGEVSIVATNQGPMIDRKEFHRFMGKAAWPLAPIVVEQFAMREGAPDSVIEVIEQVPNRIYLSEGDFWEEFCKTCRERGQTFHA